MPKNGAIGRSGAGVLANGRAVMKKQLCFLEDTTRRPVSTDRELASGKWQLLYS